MRRFCRFSCGAFNGQSLNRFFKFMSLWALILPCNGLSTVQNSAGSKNFCCGIPDLPKHKCCTLVLHTNLHFFGGRGPRTLQ